MGPLPALLFDATYHGTLAAVRSLGRAGIPVVVADPRRLTPATWSRYTTRSVRCPPVADAEAFVAWLVRFGERHGRHVVYPTSDEVAFLLAENHVRLEPLFATYQPDLDHTLGILDKKRLHGAAETAGIQTPETRFPTSAREAQEMADGLDGPVLFKPRTQLFLRAHRKGEIVSDRARVADAYAAFRRDNVYLPPVAERTPELTQPMLQRYYSEAADGIGSVSGFRSRDGKVLAVLGALKILQRPRRLGIGLCFESQPVEPELLARVTRMLEELSYFGVFELEFIEEQGGARLLIDMNPRFYSQVELDVARGLDLPRMAYAAAMRDDDGLAALARGPNGGPRDRAFRNSIGVHLVTGAQRVFGTMSRDDAERWRSWARSHGEHMVDPIVAKDDPGPFFAESATQAYECLRHPRSFLRTIALDRS